MNIDVDCDRRTVPEVRAASVSGEAFSKVMANFAAGVTIVTTGDAAGRPFGLTATAFCSVAKEPPLCMVCIGREASAYTPVADTGRFAVNLLRDGQQDLARLFASGRDDKFEQLDWSPSPKGGTPLIAGCLSCIECELVELFVGGDHGIFMGRLIHAEVFGGSPLLYCRGEYATLAPSSTEASDPQ